MKVENQCFENPKFSIPTQPTKFITKVLSKALKPFRITKNNTKMLRKSFYLFYHHHQPPWKMNWLCFSSLLNTFIEEAALFTPNKLVYDWFPLKKFLSCKAVLQIGGGRVNISKADCILKLERRLSNVWWNVLTNHKCLAV